MNGTQHTAYVNFKLLLQSMAGENGWLLSQLLWVMKFIFYQNIYYFINETKNDCYLPISMCCWLLFLLFEL